MTPRNPGTGLRGMSTADVARKVAALIDMFGGPFDGVKYAAELTVQTTEPESAAPTHGRPVRSLIVTARADDGYQRRYVLTVREMPQT